MWPICLWFQNDLRIVVWDLETAQQLYAIEVPELEDAQNFGYHISKEHVQVSCKEYIRAKKGRRGKCCKELHRAHSGKKREMRTELEGARLVQRVKVVEGEERQVRCNEHGLTSEMQ